jgi:hypothetical protein
MAVVRTRPCEIEAILMFGTEQRKQREEETNNNVVLCFEKYEKQRTCVDYINKMKERAFYKYWGERDYEEVLFVKLHMWHWLGKEQFKKNKLWYYFLTKRGKPNK